MKTKKRLPGRPKKKMGELEFWRFVRAGLIMCVYDEERESGHKHSSEVSRAVEFVRELHPEIPVSETEVRHTLATYRPINSRTILRFKRSICDDGKVARLRCMLEQVANVRGEKNQSVSPPSLKKWPNRLTAIQFGYSELPLYPRHNRKIPND